jgi:hypothetical protein
VWPFSERGRLSPLPYFAQDLDPARFKKKRGILQHSAIYSQERNEQKIGQKKKADTATADLDGTRTSIISIYFRF